MDRKKSEIERRKWHGDISISSKGNFFNMEREQMTIRLPVGLKERIQQEADRRGDSFNETVIRLVRLGLESQSNRCSAHSLL